MENQNENQLQSTENIGPHTPTFFHLLLNSFAGLGSGIAGTVILFLVFLISSTILTPVTEVGTSTGVGNLESAAQNPLFIFIVIATVFLASLVSNIVGALLFSFVRHEKYTRNSTTIYQIFFINLCIFVLLAPVYLVLNAQNLISIIGMTALMHVAVAAFASLVILEIVGNTKYALVGVYNVIVGLLIAFGIITVLFQFSQNAQSILLFVTLPILWSSMGAMNVIGDMVYKWIYTVWGSDVLMVATDFGRDYGGDEEEISEEDLLPPDKSGADFLKGN